MAQPESIVFTIFLIFSGAALLATAVLFTRQSLLVAYILLGIILGPWGLQFVNDPHLVMQIGEVGIMFLLFLLGLHLHPQNLVRTLRKVSWVTLVSSIIFAFISFVVCFYQGFTAQESIIIGAAMMFSSTIIGLKLLPTNILHHQHIGEVMISVLLMQDLIAIIVLLAIHGARDGFSVVDISIVLIALPGLIALALLAQRFIITKLLAKFDQVQEYIFLLSIGWCLGLAQLSSYIGLSEEIGAFIAGIALAASPIALYIAESLKPLRDFFLVMFFFSIGAGFNFSYIEAIIVPALLISVLMLLVKPLSYRYLLSSIGESKQVSKEVAIRLGQASEFSLLVGTLAVSSHLISSIANSLIQAITIITFFVSSYIIVLRYPTPMGLTENMRQS